MESRIRRYIGNNSFRILLTSKANGERFSKCSGILLEGVEGGVLYLLPEPEAERIMKEKDERFCLGVGKEHHSVMEIPEAYQEALLARGNGIYTEKSCGRNIRKNVLRKSRNWHSFRKNLFCRCQRTGQILCCEKCGTGILRSAHQRVSPYQLLAVTEAICKELDLFHRVAEKQEKMSAPSAVP